MKTFTRKREKEESEKEVKSFVSQRRKKKKRNFRTGKVNEIFFSRTVIRLRGHKRYLFFWRRCVSISDERK